MPDRRKFDASAKPQGFRHAYASENSTAAVTVKIHHREAREGAAVVCGQEGKDAYHGARFVGRRAMEKAGFSCCRRERLLHSFLSLKRRKPHRGDDEAFNGTLMHAAYASLS